MHTRILYSFSCVYTGNICCVFHVALDRYVQCDWSVCASIAVHFTLSMIFKTQITDLNLIEVSLITWSPFRINACVSCTCSLGHVCTAAFSDSQVVDGSGFKHSPVPLYSNWSTSTTWPGTYWLAHPSGLHLIGLDSSYHFPVRGQNFKQYQNNSKHSTKLS